MRALALALLASLACGCSYSVHEVNAAGFAPADPAPPGAPRHAERIESRAEQDVVLGVVDNTDYVDEAYAALLAQCPGDVVGLSTRISSSLGFLSYTNVVQMRALCLR